MKRTMTFVLLAFAIISSGALYGGEPCSDVTSVKFAVLDNGGQKVNKIKSALANYTSHPDLYFSDERSRYEICFETGEFEIKNSDLLAANFNGSFVLQNAPNNDVYVKDLNFKVGNDVQLSSPLLTVTNNSASKIILDSISLTNVKHGLAFSGTGPIEMHGKGVIAGDATKSGNCLAIASPNAIVDGTDISSCGEGIRIEASGALIGAKDAANYDADKNTIHENGIGIHVVSGDLNKFPYNSVYKNAPIDGESEDNGILINAGANEGLARPDIIIDEETEKAVVCTKDENGKVLSREINFEIPKAGEIEIYKADGEVKTIKNQGMTFIGKCSVGIDGKCVLDNLQLAQLDINKCGIEGFYVTALFTGTSSTMYTVQPFELDGRFSVPSPPPFDLPTTQDHQTVPEDEDSDDSTVTTQGVGASDGSGDGGNKIEGISSCRGTISASEGGSAAQAIILLFPFTFLICTRLTRRRR